MFTTFSRQIKKSLHKRFFHTQQAKKIGVYHNSSRSDGSVYYTFSRVLNHKIIPITNDKLTFASPKEYAMIIIPPYDQPSKKELSKEEVEKIDNYLLQDGKLFYFACQSDKTTQLKWKDSHCFIYHQLAERTSPAHKQIAKVETIFDEIHFYQNERESLEEINAHSIGYFAENDPAMTIQKIDKGCAFATSVRIDYQAKDLIFSSQKIKKSLEKDDMKRDIFFRQMLSLLGLDSR